MATVKPARMELVDALRGFALMGLFLVHMVELFELYWAHPTGGPVIGWVFGLFGGKAYALFALCFGLSFFIIMDRAKARGVDFTGRFAWRLTLLLIIGMIHGVLYRGDILVVLALLGFTLLVFDRIRSNRLLVALAVLCFLQLPLLTRAVAATQGAAWALAPFGFATDPSMTVLTGGNLFETLAVNATEGQRFKWAFMLEAGRVTQILGLFLTGLVLGRIGFFERPDRFRLSRRVALLLALAAWGALHLGKAGLLGAAPEPARGSLGWAIDGYSALALMIAELLIFVEIYQSAAQPLLRALVPAGRMTLTLYLLQSLVFVPVFYGFGLEMHDDLTSGAWLAIGLVAFAAQVAFARLWFRSFHYGPVEWVWRAGTYLTTDVPFRKAAANASTPAIPQAPEPSS
jgi:uncharacterized protein